MDASPHRSSAHKRRIILAAALLVGVLLIAVSGLLPWPTLNCVYHDVDIRTGRLRETRCLLCCRLSEHTVDSAITSALGPHQPGIAQPEWHRVNTFAPAWVRVSPHHAFHGAIAQINSIETAWKLTKFSADAKQLIAERLLNRWQSSQDDFGAEDLVHVVLSVAAKAHGNTTQVVEPKDLPIGLP